MVHAAMPETTAIVTALILERPLCMNCITARTGVPAAEIDATLARIQTVLHVERHTMDRCRSCGTVGPVLSLQRPPS